VRGRAYDTADRPTTGANGTGTYTYDQLGRQTAIPAADAPKPADGDITLGYYDTDNTRTITQGGQTTSFTLDGAGRRLTQTQTGTSLVRHYTDSGDNPTWSVDTTGTTTTTTRYNELINGDLGLTFTTTGTTTTAELALDTPRGDTATTITLPTGGTNPTGTAATGIDTWTDYTEYGIPRQPPATTPGGTTGIGYGWLGAKQRSTLDTGLLLMGLRVYNPSTGPFTSLDPIAGGSANNYNYSNADPINQNDITGACPFCVPLLIIGGRIALSFAARRIGQYLIRKGVQSAARSAARQFSRDLRRNGVRAYRNISQNQGRSWTRTSRGTNLARGHEIHRRTANKLSRWGGSYNISRHPDFRLGRGRTRYGVEIESRGGCRNMGHCVTYNSPRRGWGR
jgi:RHS repeat-associated protein